MDISMLVALLRSGNLHSVELVQYYIDRIEKFDKDINSVIDIDKAGALEKAKVIDEKRKRGEQLHELAGIPVGLKSIIGTTNLVTDASSEILRGYIPAYPATVTKLLEETGMIILAKLNQDEFAMGSSTENSIHGKTHNPWDLSRVSGGSSGGSAAAVAARILPVTLGTDTGGSVRQPASFCGVSGLRPTYGRLSRYGVVAYASSLDQVGVFGRSAKDIAYLMNVLAKYDVKDSTSVDFSAPDYMEKISEGSQAVSGMKIGVPVEFFDNSLNPTIKKSLQEAIDKYKKLGCTIEEVSLPHVSYSIPTYYIIATAEASSNLARYDGVRYGNRAETSGGGIEELYSKTRSLGFGAEVKRRILLGTYVLSSGYYDAYYLRAQKVRKLIANDFSNVFKKVDAILSPATPTTAFKFGYSSSNPVDMYLMDIYTVSLNLFGGCGLSIPCGFDEENLPIGMQLLGNHFQEEKLLKLANAYQEVTDFHNKMPNHFDD